MKKQVSTWQGRLLRFPRSGRPAGKPCYAWAAEADLDPARVVSNTFTMEWPPRSGRQQAFPEVDRAAWFPLEDARLKILSGQVPLLEQVVE